MQGKDVEQGAKYKETGQQIPAMKYWARATVRVQKWRRLKKKIVGQGCRAKKENC